MGVAEKTAVDKAKAVFEYGWQYFQGEDKYDDYVKVLEDIAKEFGGDTLNTGGHVFVAIIPVDEHFSIGVTDESVVLYYLEKSDTSASHIFWEGEQYQTWDYS